MPNVLQLTRYDSPDEQRPLDVIAQHVIAYEPYYLTDDGGEEPVSVEIGTKLWLMGAPSSVIVNEPLADIRKWLREALA